MFAAYNGPDVRQAPANLVPVGTGPYRVMAPGIIPREVIILGRELVETNKILYEPNPFFREAGKPFFSRVEWKGGGLDSEAARAVLQNGEVDYAHFLVLLPPEELAQLETGGQGRLVTVSGSTVERILLNHTAPHRETATSERSSLEFPHPFFSDKRVRRAFAHAINRETIAALYDSSGHPVSNILVAPPNTIPPTVFTSLTWSKRQHS